MSRHLGLAVARMHGLLATRPRSGVFHVYAGPLTPSGRSIPRAARAVCSARTRRLSVLERDGSVLDLGGRRMCARCSARLSAVARRAEQPLNRDACLEFYAGISLRDLVVAIALTETVDETHRVAFVLSLLFGQAPAIRPAEPTRPIPADELYRLRGRQALFDVNTELVRRRRHLVAAERTPEEIEALRMRREADIARDAQILANRRRAAAMDRAIDRRNRGSYMTPRERELVADA